MFEKILVAVDGSRDADAAVRAATTIARARESSLDVCHVFQIPDHYRADLDDAVEDALKEDAENALAHAARVAAETEVEVRQHLLDKSDPAAAILELAASLNVSLIVVGVRGKSPDAVRPLGSVSSAVSEGAGCSVLLVRRKPGE